MKPFVLSTLLSSLALGAVLITATAVSQAQVLDEDFGVPQEGICPSTLPAGWVQFKGNDFTRHERPWPVWPDDALGWAMFGLGSEMFPAHPQYVENCAPMSAANYDSPEPANDWLVSPSVQIPPNARLRYLTSGTDAYEVRFTANNAGPDAMLADSSVLLNVIPGDELTFFREVDLSHLIGQSGHIAFRNMSGDRGFLLVVDDVWLGSLPPGEHPITTEITPADGSGGELICPSGVAHGGTAACSALSMPGYTFHYSQGIGGCDQPGDTLAPNNNRCTMTNVQGPRTLTGTFVPYLPPPTDIMVRHEGDGNLAVGWTPPDTILPLGEYRVALVPISFDPVQALFAECPPETGPLSDHSTGAGCTLSGYQKSTAYLMNVGVAHVLEWGFPGNAVQLAAHQTVQFATVDVPGGEATFRMYGPPLQLVGDNGEDAEDSGATSFCLLSGAPAALTPASDALADAGAPEGSEAPLGALQVEALGCEGRTLKIAVDYPAGSLAGLQAFAQMDDSWSRYGTIVGDTIHYVFAIGAIGDTGVPGPQPAIHFNAVLAPLQLLSDPGPGPGPGPDPSPGADQVQPVPTVGPWALGLLTGMAGFLAWRSRRGRH